MTVPRPLFQSLALRGAVDDFGPAPCEKVSVYACELLAKLVNRAAGVRPREFTVDEGANLDANRVGPESELCQTRVLREAEDPLFGRSGHGI